MKNIVYATSATFWIIAYTAYAQQSCNTPKNRPGVCIDGDTCPMILSILNNGRRSRNNTILLRDSSCGFVNGKSKFCCELSEGISNCTTPNNEAGICISSLDCLSLLELSEDKTNRLTNSACDSNPSSRVCCPHNIKPKNSDLLPPRPNCGREAKVYNVAQLVDGESQIDQFPWVAVIEYKNKILLDIKSYFMCSAVLISSRYVLTVAQCFYSSKLGGKVAKNVILGEYDLTTGKYCNVFQACNEKYLKVPIEKIVSHQNFNLSVMKNDIALVRMDRDVQFTEYIRPICLPQMNVNENFPDTLVHFVISGWNLMINNVAKITATRKQHLQVPIKKRADCQKIYDEISFKLLDEHVCAGGELGKSPCKGDSGIPLISFRNNQYELIGVLSYGATQCGIHVPNLYTNVFSYIDWIRENVEK